MRHVILLLLFCVCTSTSVAETIRFLQTIPEIPLPSQGVEFYEEAVVFDAPNGRIIEVEVGSAVKDSTEIISYYSELLPSLGWRKISQNSFLKENEHLKLEYLEKAVDNRILILLRPAN